MNDWRHEPPINIATQIFLRRMCSSWKGDWPEKQEKLRFREFRCAFFRLAAICALQSPSERGIYRACHDRFLPFSFDVLRTERRPAESGKRSTRQHRKAHQRAADSRHLEGDPFVQEIQGGRSS